MSAGRFAATVYHLRPSLWPFIWVHALTGLAVGSGMSATDLGSQVWLHGLVAAGLWAVLVNGAAVGLASLFEVMPVVSAETDPFAQSPQIERQPAPPAPSTLGWTAVCMLLAGLVISPVVAWRYFDICLLGMIVALVYATPPIRFRKFFAGSVILQAVAYGALTFCAGVAALGPFHIELRVVVLYLIGFMFLFGALRTLFLAPSRMLPWLYATCLVGAFVCFGLAETRVGGKWGAALLGVVPLAGWCVLGAVRFFGCWCEDRRVRLFSVLCVWFLTDAALLLSTMVR